MTGRYPLGATSRWLEWLEWLEWERGFAASWALGVWTSLSLKTGPGEEPLGCLFVPVAGPDRACLGPRLLSSANQMPWI